jgi:hypothetical protein
MRVVLEEAHRGYQVVIRETPHVVYIGRSPLRQWRYRALVNNEDVSAHVDTQGIKPTQIAENVKRFLDAQLTH